jgi:hypothetical protein
VQEDPERNRYFDAKDRTVEEVIDPRESAIGFQDFSNVNLRRLPGIGAFVHRVKLHDSPLTWVAENPSLIKALFYGGLGAGLILLYLGDRALRRIYARRFGVTLQGRTQDVGQVPEGDQKLPSLEANGTTIPVNEVRF